MTNVKVSRKDVVSDKELQSELAEANKLSTFLRLRARATIALLETGKRRGELARLERGDFTKDSKFRYVRFTIEKKRKKNVNILQRIKKYNLDSPWSKMIQEYLDYLDEHFPTARYVYPWIHSTFGQSFMIDPNKHADPKIIWRIIKTLNNQDWPHLHRERRAVKVIKHDEEKYGEAKLETVYRIKNILDLEREQTAYNYVRRHETQKVEDEEPIS